MLYASAAGSSIFQLSTAPWQLAHCFFSNTSFPCRESAGSASTLCEYRYAKRSSQSASVAVGATTPLRNISDHMADV